MNDLEADSKYAKHLSFNRMPKMLKTHRISISKCVVRATGNDYILTNTAMPTVLIESSILCNTDS